MDNKQWKTICSVNDLVADSGICALINETEQVAIFTIPKREEKVFAVGNFDPFGKANVLSRGLIGCIGGEPVVSSPLYKQHFSLKTGKCLQEDISIATYQVRIEDDAVQLLV